jgi:hypothetical protein
MCRSAPVRPSHQRALTLRQLLFQRAPQQAGPEAKRRVGPHTIMGHCGTACAAQPFCKIKRQQWCIARGCHHCAKAMFLPKTQRSQQARQRPGIRNGVRQSCQPWTGRPPAQHKLIHLGLQPRDHMIQQRHAVVERQRFVRTEAARLATAKDGPKQPIAQRVSSKSSRPISMRRISEVPAPISYNLASRSRRPVGYSLM